MLYTHMFLHYVIPLALVGTAFALARKRTEGAQRYCLLGFLGTVFCVTLAYFALNIVRNEGLVGDETYRNLTSGASSFFLVLNIASLALLVTYVFLLGKLEHGPTGYGGWLKFYVVVHRYVAPIAVVAAGIFVLPSLLRIAGAYAGLVGFIAAQYAVLLGVTALGAYAAGKVREIDAAGLRLTRVYLWLLLATPAVSVAIGSLIEMPESVRFEFLEKQLLDLMKALVVFIVWTSYFRISRRVRNSFAPVPGPAAAPAATASGSDQAAG